MNAWLAASRISRQAGQRQRYSVSFARTSILANECVQKRQTCSVGVSLIRERVRSSVAWVASAEETKRMKPIDKAVFRTVSKSPGRNGSEPEGGLEKYSSGGRALSFGAKAA